jgi:hypothetical protein
MCDIFDGFTQEDKLNILEIARVALGDADFYEGMVRCLDMSDEEAQKLSVKIERVMNA